jgi:hypothetical protein
MQQEEQQHTQTTFMKRFKLMISNLIQRLRQKVKIWQSLSIEANLKHSKAKFKVGDEVLIKNNNEVGVVLEVHIKPKLRGDSLDEFQYLVQLPYKYNKNLLNYFNEITLDYSLQKKRDDRLKELGI